MDLIEHARRELIIANVSSEEIERYIPVLEIAIKAGFAINEPFNTGWGLVGRLLAGDTLTPLTDNEDEWDVLLADHPGGIPVWRNIRNPNALSFDAGKTYMLLDDRGFRSSQPSDPVDEYSGISMEVLDEVSPEGD